MRSETHFWQNSSTLDFRPLNAISASLSARQSLDLRDYDSLPGVSDSLNRARAARAPSGCPCLAWASGSSVSAPLVRHSNFVLVSRRGFEPGVRFSNTFSLYKDPNARASCGTVRRVAAYRLPKRLGALQLVDASLNFDAGRLLMGRSKETSRWNRLGRAVLPLHVDWSRTLTSNYDNTVLNPSLGYQFGVGGLQSFRGLNSVLATGAGRLTNFAGSAAVQLPLSFTVRGAFQQGSAQTWTRRVIDNFQALISSTSKTFPNVDATWRLTLAEPNKVLSGLTATLGYVVTENTTMC